MTRCKCGSYAVNPNLYNRGNDNVDLCDVCYWKVKYEALKASQSMQFLGMDFASDYLAKVKAEGIREAVNSFNLEECGPDLAYHTIYLDGIEEVKDYMIEFAAQLEKGE